MTLVTTAMGGRLAVHLDADGDEASTLAAAAAAAQTVARIRRWADRLTRHEPTSDLCALNDDPRPEVAVGPTLAAALQAGREAADMSEGLVDIGMLDARLAAEGVMPSAGVLPGSSGGWTLTRGHRGVARISRPTGVQFDLGGVAKGWIADRALDLLGAWPSAVVDADGDLAVRTAPGRSWQVGVDDPRLNGRLLAILRLTADTGGCPGRWGIATSGTSVHRWTGTAGVRHHLIDPRTRAPAVTDVVQATVVTSSALRAEALAKAAVILGSADGLALLERARVAGAVILTERNEVLALPSTLGLLVPEAVA